MSETQPTLAGQVAALIDAVGDWQSEAMQALQAAIDAAQGVDQAQLTVLINQHLKKPVTVELIASALVQSDNASQALATLVQQHAATEISTVVRDTVRYLPDTRNATLVLADRFSTGQTVTFTPSGAITPEGSAVIWQLTDLVGVTASATQIADGQSVTLTITGPGHVNMTAISNGVAAETVTRSWGIEGAVMQPPSVLTPAADTVNLALRPVITTSAYSVSPADYDTHSHSQCQIRTIDSSVLWDSGEVSATTEFAVDTDLPAETALDIVVRYKGSHLGWGNWSTPARVTTEINMTTGAVLADGGIVGPVFNGYRLIVAPASKRGESIRHGLYYGTDTSLTNIRNSSTPDPQSGYDNTDTLINGYSGVNDGYVTGPAAAILCRGLGPEWYLPNKDELAAIVAIADEIDAADSSTDLSFVDIGTGWIWSSTEYSSSHNWVVRASDGDIDANNRTYQLFVVPVRRVPV